MAAAVVAGLSASAVFAGPVSIAPIAKSTQNTLPPGLEAALGPQAAATLAAVGLPAAIAGFVIIGTLIVITLDDGTIITTTTTST